MTNCLFVIKDIDSGSYDDNTLSKISSIHQRVLKNGFLSWLGNSFLKSIYREPATDFRLVKDVPLINRDTPAKSMKIKLF